MATKKSKKARARRNLVVFGERNVLLLMAGLIVILIGYLLLGRGSITAAPILLVLGYCVMVPLSIILWTKQSKDKEPRSGE